MLEPDTDSEDEVPHGWEERVTPEGWVYYANHFTKITKWEHPKTNKRKRVAKELPYGWERLEDEDGRTYYVDHVSKRTTYTDPRLAFAVNITEKKGNYQQRFDGSSTTDAVLEGTDLRGKVAIVTGASSGIGLETARALACHGAKVIMACRDTSKTMDVIQSIKKDRDDADLVFMRLDLCSLQSVAEFAEEFASKSWPLHMLILNAAVFALPWQLTEDRIERTFATNHVGHFHLTKMLEKSLLASAPARVVVLSSESHRYPDMEEPTLEKLSPPVSQFWYMTQYNRSKLCNILFSNELNRRLYRRGVTSNSVHPGNMMYTSLSSSSWLMRAAFFLARPFTKSMKQGAACSVYAAAAPELEGLGGLYFNNCCVCDTSVDGSNPAAAARLWTITEDLISDRLRARRKEIARGQADNRSRDSSSTISDA